MASKKQTIITLNGLQYDATTGEAVTVPKSVQTMNDVIAPRTGMQAAKTQVAVPTPAPTELPTTPVPQTGPKVMDVSRSVGHTKPRQIQRANTLVRTAVSKPKPGLKSQLQVVAPADQLLPSTNTVVPKWAISQVNPARQSRATTVAKSEAISKFSNTPVDPNLAAREAAQVRISASPVEAVQAIEQQSDQSHDLFERAIAAAESHTFAPYDQKKLARQSKKQAKSASKTTKRPVHHHLASVVAASVAVLVIGGVIGLQNKTALTLRFANAQAGFKASLPTYQPSGYGVDSFSYSAGNVGTTFHDTTSDRDYTLNQQTTKWDSQDLLDNFVAMNYPSYQTLQSGDQVIYVYKDNNASWVKDGIWYQLTSNGNLSTSQVLNIAASV